MNTYVLLEIFSSADYVKNYTQAKATKTCLRCGNPAKEFKDISTEFEYRISALCQTCQDKLFHGKEE